MGSGNIFDIIHLVVSNLKKPACVSELTTLRSLGCFCIFFLQFWTSNLKTLTQTPMYTAVARKLVKQSKKESIRKTFSNFLHYNNGTVC